MRKIYFVLLIALFGTMQAKAQITVTSSQTATALAQELVGSGVIVTNATMNCPAIANGIFTAVNSNLGFDSGIVLTSGRAMTVNTSSPSTTGANAAASFFADNANGTAGDADLNSLIASNQTGHDACTLEFDFQPAGDTVKFDYVFGSEEYTSFTCTQYNDVFGFFISGPGYTTNTNVALVPGTTIAVAVNSVNNGPTGGGTLSTCQAMGPGSPFSAYYVDNSTGTTVVYDGMTVVMTAQAAVTPCQTYHLKMGVEDVGDDAYDSGVFLKAGSLNSVATSITPVGGGGLVAPVPYCVRGCLPGKFMFTRPQAADSPLVIHYAIQGTAVNGTDYVQIPDSVVIPAFDTVAFQNIQGIVLPAAVGPKTVQLLIYSPYNCSNNAPNIIDSATLTIFDSLYVRVLSPDTSICRYNTVPLIGDGDSILHYQWSPSSTVASPTSMSTTATPLATTTYVLTATLPGSGCPPAHDEVTVTVKQAPTVDVGPDVNTCLGVPIQFNANITPANQSYHVQWTPGTYLNNDTIVNPICNATSDVTYVITADPGAASCIGYDTVHVHILPNDFTLYNHDTAICKGATVPVNGSGDTAFTYIWTPSDGVANPNSLVTDITPDTSGTYTITATFPGCPDMVHTIAIDVQPNPFVLIGGNKEMCEWDTIHMNPSITPGWYNNYIYNWTPATAFDFADVKTPVFLNDSSTEIVLTVTTPAGCKGIDSVYVTVHPGNFASLLTGVDTAICPGDSVHLITSGGLIYHWTPGFFLNDSTSNNPVVHPVATDYYTAYVTDQYGCFDTLYSTIVVHPKAVVSVPDSTTIYPGESYQMDPQGNCLYFQWFPPLGLTAADISNPVASPDVNTKYIVNAATEFGCTATDTIDVIVDPETLLAVPNGFTPGNGPNNELKIIKRGIATLKYFRIFNRWGVQVFSTSDINQGWDGTYNGTPQPMGVYVYMVEAETSTGRQFVKQGNVTLIR